MLNRIPFSIIPALAVAVSAVMPISAYAQSNDGLVWGFSQYNDDNNQGRSTAVLRFSIPETDAVAVSGECVNGVTDQFSNIKFGHDVSGYRESQSVIIRFDTGNFFRDYQGNITGTQAEFGVSGTSVTIGHNDPLWRALQRGNRVTYSIDNGRFNTLSLQGSSGPIQQYIQSCKFYAQGFAGNDQDNEENNPGLSDFSDPRRALCNEPRFQRSVESKTPLTVKFRNQSGGYRSVMWMSFQGQPTEYANLNPGEEFTIQTYLTHPWMFTDGPGNCMEMFMPQLGVDTFNITAPNP